MSDIDRESLTEQKRLQGLGYELIDANRPVEEVADDVVRRLRAPS
jgi:hypothetical protein